MKVQKFLFIVKPCLTNRSGMKFNNEVDAICVYRTGTLFNETKTKCKDEVVTICAHMPSISSK